MGAPNMQPDSGSHLVELTLEAFRVAHRASSSAAEGIATSSKALLREVRDRERELAGQRTGAAAGPSERDSLPGGERGRGNHDQYRERLERARAAERSDRDHAGDGHGRQHDQPANGGDRPHGWNR